MNEADDDILVKQCLSGNKQAFEAVVDKYQQPLFNVAYRFLDCFEDAEDVTQTVFIKAFEKLHTYNNRYKLFSWLYKIAVHESLNYRNARKPNQTLNENIVSKDATPEKSYNQRELAKNMGDALNRLKDEYRIVIILKHYQDLSYEEMSKILEIPVKTVKSRLFTARQQLREILVQGMYI